MLISESTAGTHLQVKCSKEAAESVALTPFLHVGGKDLGVRLLPELISCMQRWRLSDGISSS